MCKLNVLIVDDSAVFRRAAQILVASFDRVGRVECANSGAQALARAAELHPDLVLMDIVMPGMNGIEAIRVLRERVPALRVYAVSLQDSPEHRAAALANGAFGFVPKHEFARAIPEVIEQTPCSSAAALPAGPQS